MADTPLKKLARDLGLSVKRLTTELEALGVEVAGEEHLVTNEQNLQLSRRLREPTDESEIPKEITLEAIQSCTDLLELNKLLTRAMADRKIQALIKDKNLDAIVEQVLELNTDSDQELLTAAILGRLAAVARGRKEQILKRADEVFSTKPASIETLEDGDAKSYAAAMMTHCSDYWVKEYAYREALTIDTADNARRELLAANLLRESSLATWLAELTKEASEIRQISNIETRYRRIRRVASAVLEVAERWRGVVGDEPGLRISMFMKSLFGSNASEVDQEIVVDAMDSLLAVLRRVIELRFSNALYPELYAILIDAKSVLGAGLWGRVLSQAEAVSDVRRALLEAVLVLARQDKYDNDMMVVLRAAFGTRAQMTSAIKRHFSEVKDLDPSVSEWWCKGGGGQGDREQAAQRIRKSEDEKIGELLLKVEASEAAMNKLRSAVLPILQSMNPVLAKTVDKAARDYREMAREVSSLARMRQLKTAGLMSERMEYNRRLHDMEGGHYSGVRYIKVIRDGVEKTFAGKTKMLVKPIVEPED